MPVNNYIDLPVEIPIRGVVSLNTRSYTDGLTGALTLTTNGLLRVDGSNTIQPVSGTVTANQGGVWNITNITGTISLPTGASTLVAQNTGNASLASINTKQSDNLQTTQLVNSSGNAVAVKTLSSTPLGTDYGLETNSLMYGLTTAGGGGYVPVKVNPSGTMLVDASGSIVPVSQSGTWNIATVTALTAITNALPAGANVIGHVITDSGSVTAATLSAETTKVIGTVNISAGQTVGLVAGSAVIGHVINDAGSAIIGKVGIDQTTPGTTNGVQVNAALPAGSNVIGHVITDSGSVVNATLSAETTKVIGTVNQGTSPWVTSASQSGNWSVRNLDGSGNSLTSQANGAQRALDVGIDVAGVQIDPRTAAPGTLTDRSGTATSVSTTVMAANASRRFLFIQNLGNAPIYINFTSAATVGAGSIELSQFASFVMEDSFITTEAVTVIRSGGANLAFTAKEG